MEEIQELNGDFFQYEDPLIASYNQLCSGYQSAYVCTNEKCSNNAFICGNIQCDCLRIMHSKCGTKTALDLFLRRMRKQKKEIPNKIKQMFKQVIQNYDSLIEKISEDKFQFIQYTSMYGLTEDSIKAIKLINEGRVSQISGELVYPIYYGALRKPSNNQIYFPDQMTHSNGIKDTLSELGLLFNKIAFQLVDSDTKNDLALKKLQINEILTTQIKQQKKLNWDFIPTEISLFKNVKKISLNSQNIRKIQNLQQLVHLQEILLNDNNISKIENLGSLTCLKFLELKHNFIDQIQGVETLTNLQVLNLQKNKINKLENLGNLPSLKLLRLSTYIVISYYNQIKKIQNLQHLINLQSLYLNHNIIANIENLEGLTQLQVLNLEFNAIKKFEKLEQLDNLHYLNLGNNPIEITRDSMKRVEEVKKKGVIIFIT